MNTTTRETQITADPDVPLVRITREFDAPPAKVFRAHTDPSLVVQWLGPRDLQMRIDHFDCRTGGSYRYVHTRDGEEYGSARLFKVIKNTCDLGPAAVVEAIFVDIDRHTGGGSMTDDQSLIALKIT
jgi:hypothetical protein